MSKDTLIATPSDVLTERIHNKSARAGVIGLGYVGLPLAVEFAKAGYSVTGFDVDQSKVDRLNSGVSYVQDVPGADVATLSEKACSGPPRSSACSRNWTRSTYVSQRPCERPRIQT